MSNLKKLIEMEKIKSELSEIFNKIISLFII